MYAVKLDFENKAVLEANLSQLKQELALHHAPAADPANASVEAFAKMSVEKQQAILSNISTYIRILSQEIAPELDRSPRVREIARLKWALHQFGLRAANNDVFNNITLDDVIELYNLQGIQLYRNMRFFKVCSYNLLDLSVNSWENLYDKPTHVIDATQRVIEKLFTSGDQAIPYNIGTYLQKEKYDFARSLKTLQVTPRYIVPLFDLRSGEPAGAFSTYSAEVIAEGDQSSRFNTI
jgi:hypothetical protein